MDRDRNEEVCRRVGIERELASRADHRVLRWFGHVERVDEYRMARKVLMAEVSGGRVRGRPEVRLYGWCEGGLVQQRNDGGCCASMSKRSERVKNPSKYVTMNFMRPFLLGPLFFRTALPCSGDYRLEREDAVT